MDIKFNGGLGSIYFKMNQDEIIEQVGNPDDIIISSEGVIEMHYDDKGFTFFIHDDYNSIHANRIIICNEELNAGTTEYSDLIPLIEKYHEQLEVEYIAMVKDDENEKMIFFPNIGITFWLEGCIVNDISIESIETNEEE